MVGAKEKYGNGCCSSIGKGKDSIKICVAVMVTMDTVKSEIRA